MLSQTAALKGAMLASTSTYLIILGFCLMCTLISSNTEITFLGCTLAIPTICVGTMLIQAGTAFVQNLPKEPHTVNVSYMRVWWKQRHQKEEQDRMHASDLSQINRRVHQSHRFSTNTSSTPPKRSTLMSLLTKANLVFKMDPQPDTTAGTANSVVCEAWRSAP